MRSNSLSYLLVVVCLLISDSIWAQEVMYPEMRSTRVYATPNAALTLSTNSVLEHLTMPEGSRLVKINEVESPFGVHTTYQQYINESKVLFAGVKVHQATNGHQVVQNYLYTGSLGIVSQSDLLMPTNVGLVPVFMRQVKDLVHPKIEYVTSNGMVLISSEQYQFAKEDTTLFSKVFMVNPINSADTSYGGNFIDNKDSTNSSLDAQLVWVSNPAKVENGIYFLESEFLSFEDISAPTDLPFTLSNDSASFTRDEDEFEYMNVYFHINTFGEYVNSLGYDALTQLLKVDVHAFGGADNSAYDPFDHTLQFGDGGVDDAEDGEVIIHEFTHSLSEIASPFNTEGTQRKAMEEGTCDYFAKSYSRSINDNTPNRVFSWDGHNPFWDGFGINTKRAYPQDLANSKDGDRDIWSSALMCGHDFIGRLPMDSLVLEHLYYQGANTTMPQMAKIILDIDSSDFNSRYQGELKQCFIDAGFMVRGASIAKVKKSPFSVLNQSAFALGEGKLTILTPEKIDAIVYDAMGRAVYTVEHQDRLVLSPEKFTPGMYVVYIKMGDFHFTQKIIR
ncbi:MAG: hypothetical protein ACI80H_001249 [Pseudoalteromonas distincta]|jgi:hypothetical protein